MSENPYTMTKFMDLLICSFVLHEKLELCIIGDDSRSKRDRNGLWAMHEQAEKAVDSYVRKMGDTDGEAWFHFLVRTRNVLDPEHQGSFPELRRELVNKTATLVNLLSPHDGSYHFHKDRALAQSIFVTGAPRLQFYTTELVDAFMLKTHAMARARV